jgi:ribosomal protein S18 acetylase RimI-like enzyme
MMPNVLSANGSGRSSAPPAIELRPPHESYWLQIAALLAATLPNALVSHFGPRFGALYYRHFAESPDGFCRVACRDSGRVVGVVIGTRDRNLARRLSLPLLLRLLAAAHLRLLSPRFLGWLCATFRSTAPPRAPRGDHPQAELLDVAVAPDCRGVGLATCLLVELEKFLCSAGERHPYLILTEEANAAANALYRRLGAHCAGTYLFHGRAINQWHKLPD